MFRYGNPFIGVRVTLREVIASVVIASIMLIFGFLIGGAIDNAHMNKNEEYNKAAKIEQQNLFEYGMQTNLGNAFVYGPLKAVDTVTYPYLSDEYMWVEKITEKYTRHVSTHTDSEGKTHTKITYSWDVIASESKHSQKLMFMDNEFSYDKIEIPGSSYITKDQKLFSTIRYKYYGVGTEHIGTLYTDLRDNTIADHSKFYKDKTIKECREGLEVNVWLIIFWIAWSILIAAMVVVFVILENR